LRPLAFEILQVGKKVCKLRREQQPSDRLEKREIWTVGFYVQEELRRSAQKRRS
jgi:hypothetical protein